MRCSRCLEPSHSLTSTQRKNIIVTALETSSGGGKVVFADEASAGMALALNNTVLDGRKIGVKPKKFGT